ncbi:MAG: outer rane lipocarrier LolA family protein [Micavibrio sp.]|nr:outer rane lipocarrier LolA family protein [Micavibrio sp.]
MKHAFLTTGFVLALGLSGGFVSAAAAQEAKTVAPVAATPVGQMSAGDTIADYAPLVKQAGDYLNDLTTMKARFLLTSADGTQQIGTFYLDRPGRLRFEYDPPAKDFIVADGILIYFYDAQLKQQSNAPIGQTLADFLLRKNIKLSGDIKVDRVMRGGNLLQITVRQGKDPGAGSLTLGFTENPLQLKKWRVVDAQNQTVEVELFQMETGLALDSKLFVYHDPNPKKRIND